MRAPGVLNGSPTTTRIHSLAKVTPRRRGFGKFYLLIGGIAVAAIIAIALNTRPAKQDLFPVDPSAPPVATAGYLMGNEDAPVRIREWADFECPGCMQFATITEPDIRSRLVSTGLVSFEYFFFPLVEIHRSAAAAAYAAACAGDQGTENFWKMHDAIYAGFNDWAAGRARNPRGIFSGYAKAIGLNVVQWESCYDSDKFHDLITAHRAEGMQRGVNSTPTFIINDVVMAGGGTYDQIKAVVDSLLLAKGIDPAAPVAAPGADSAAQALVPLGGRN